VVGIREAYASCERLARAHYENFPVASALIPRAMRHHIAAVYAFARTADDFADEGQRPPEDRLRLLDAWHARLLAAVSDTQAPSHVQGEPIESRDVFQALSATIRECALPLALFEDLLSAFRQDVAVSRYATWTDLLDYCRRSANPIGRLVLSIAGYRNDRFDAQSDAICTALQLTNFWQDLRVDYARGRIYVPGEEIHTRGASEEDLGRDRLTAEWRQVLAAAVERTRGLFTAGRPLCDEVHGRLGQELRATWLGGTRILDKLEAAAFDPAADRVTLRRGDAPWFVWNLATWRPSPLADR
jgi:hydroxysqualene synthase